MVGVLDLTSSVGVSEGERKVGGVRGRRSAWQVVDWADPMPSLGDTLQCTQA